MGMRVGNGVMRWPRVAGIIARLSSPVELSRGEQQAVQLTRAERQTIFDALYPAGAPPPPLENLRAGHLPWRPAQRDMALLRFAAAEVRRGPGGRGPYTAILNSRRVPHLCGFSMYTRMG